ncbi:MAG: IPTL-CTERM sorting domain-containing protein [candidate division Zixibacteria bacterium]
MRLSVIICVFTFLLSSGSAIGQSPVEIWYGNPDGSPMEVPIGTEIQVPVFIRTSPDINLIYGSVLLATDDQYITSRSNANLHPPVSTWMGSWFGPFPDSPNPGITSNEWSGMDHFRTAPLHFESPTLLFRFPMTVSSDPELIGQTVTALSAGYNPNSPTPEIRWTFFIDENMNYHYPVEHYSQLTFIDANIPTLSEWGTILMGLLLLMFCSVAVIRKRKTVLGKAAFFAILIVFGTVFIAPQLGYGDEPISDNQTMLVPCPTTYVPGDFDGNGIFDTVDFIKTTNYILTGSPTPDLICECWLDDPPIQLPVALDVNGSCHINIADVAYMFENLRGGYPSEFNYCSECPPGP